MIYFCHSSLRLDTRLQLEQYRKWFGTIIHTSLSMLLFERAISILHIGQIWAKHGSLNLTFIVGKYIPYAQAFPLNAHPTFTPLS